MHERPVIRMQGGGKARATTYNEKLREDLELIDVRHPKFTMHGFRNMAIAQSREDPTMAGDAIQNGAGHTTGAHFQHYDGCLETSWMLNRANYNGTKPQMQAAHDKAFSEYLQADKGRVLVDILIREHRPAFFTLEQEALKRKTEESEDGPGHRIVECLTWIRHCLLSWIVSTAARPRSRLGLIIPRGQLKRDVVCAEFTRHLTALLKTHEYAQMEARVRFYEDAEIQLGPLANRGEFEINLTQEVRAVPSHVVQQMAPQLDRVRHDLEDEQQLRLDGDYFQSLPEEERAHLRSSLSPQDPVGTQTLRDLRLERESRKARVSVNRSALQAFFAPPHPEAGLSRHPKKAAVSAIAVASSSASPSPCSTSSASLLTAHVVGETSPPLPAITDASSPPAAPSNPSDVPDVTAVIPAASPMDTPSTACVAVPAAPPEIGTPEWFALPPDDRNASARSLLNTVGITNMQTFGVPALVRTYLRKILPLEKRPAKRGHGWRDSHTLSDPKLREAWTDLLTKTYEPIVCRVVETMEGDNLWGATEELEKIRLQLGDFDKLKALKEIVALTGKAGKTKRPPLLQRLHDGKFAGTLLQTEAPPAVVREDPVEEDTVLVPPVEGAVARYIGIDPGLSSGYAIVQVDASHHILSIHAGVLDVSEKGLTNDGERCNALQVQLRRVLTPLPTHAFIEPFFGKGRMCDAISYKLRAAIEMLLASEKVPCKEHAPQTWKKSIGGTGSAEKEKVKSAIEEMTGYAFPEKVFVAGKWSESKKKLHDASDAAAIVLCGVKEGHHPLVFADSFRILSPGLPRAREGVRLAASSLPLATVPVVASPPIPRADACTLAPGCTLRVNHAGQCHVPKVGSPRTSRKRPYAEVESGMTS